MALYKVKHGQSIYDIATQIYGSLLGISYILKDNATIDLTTHLKEGREIIINPTTVTILDQNIVNFFANRTITNTETLKGISSELSGIAYGEIVTSNKNGYTYVEGVVRANKGQIHLNNTLEGVSLERNYDRVKFSELLTLNNNGDEIEITISYEDFFTGVDKWVPLANSENREARISIIDSNKVYVYDDDGGLLLYSAVVVKPNTDVVIRIECKIIVTDRVSKDYSLYVNGIRAAVPDVGERSLSFDCIGGIIASNGLGTGDGFNGDFKYLRYNNSEYRFEEGSGNYIYKTI